MADTFNINLENELKVLIPCLAEVNSEIRSLNETFHLSLDEIGLVQYTSSASPTPASNYEALIQLLSVGVSLSATHPSLGLICHLADFKLNRSKLKASPDRLATKNSRHTSMLHLSELNSFFTSLPFLSPQRESSEEISRSMNVKYRRSVLEFLLENSKSVNTIQKMVCNMCYEVFS